MSTKKVKKSTIWKMLFAYLAISKIMYWYNTVTVAFFQGDLWGVAGAVFTRLLTDIPIIMGVFIMFYMENVFELKISKNNKILNEIITHAISYAMYMGVIIVYFWSIILLNAIESLNWIEGLIYASVAYIVVVIALDIKRYFKKKEMTAYVPVLSADEKLTMLKTLFDNNVLTQDEYDRKKEELLGAM